MFVPVLAADANVAFVEVCAEASPTGEVSVGRADTNAMQVDCFHNDGYVFDGILSLVHRVCTCLGC